MSAGLGGPGGPGGPGGRASVVVLAGSPPGPGDGLVASIGAARAAAVADLLAARAQAWATGCAGSVGGVGGGGVRLWSDGLAALIAELAASGPEDRVVVASPQLARWRADVGRAALDDLRAGCALSFGPIFDGGLYLLGATGAGLALLRDGAGAGAPDLTGTGALGAIIGLAERTGVEVGLLRTERGLRTEDDVRAQLVDPLCDGELRRLLG